MGNYVYMRGIIKLKPELIEPLRPRFSVNDKGGILMDWADLTVPDSLRLTPEFQAMGRDNWWPGSNGSAVHGDFEHSSDWPDDMGDFKPMVQLDETGVLKFYGSGKYRDDTDHWFKLIPVISETWSIEYDRRDCAWGYVENYVPERYMDPVTYQETVYKETGMFDSRPHDPSKNVTDTLRELKRTMGKQLAEIAHEKAQLREKRSKEREAHRALKAKRKKGRH